MTESKRTHKIGGTTAYSRARRERLKAAGLCFDCGRDPASKPGARCVSCLVQNKNARGRVRQRRRVASICAYCGKNPAPSGETCQACRVVFRGANKKQRRKIRQTLLTGYGCKCAECGEADPVVLDLDHVYNNGAAHRKEVGEPPGIWLWAIKHNFPPCLQLLCANCHAKKHRRIEGGLQSNRATSPQSSACNKRYYESLRSQMIAGYGGCCTNCDHDEPDELQFDHVHEGGDAHRREIGGSSDAMWRWAIRNKFPPALQLLCANCHAAKTRTGDCSYRRDRVPACGRPATADAS